MAAHGDKTSTTVRLWIGGSSGLTRTYRNAFPDEAWILLCRSTAPPSWMWDDEDDSSLSRFYYVPCDLTELMVDSTMTASTPSLLHSVMENLSKAVTRLGGVSIAEVVVGIRPALVTHRSNVQAQTYCEDMLGGLKLLLEAILQQHSVRLIIHISSIAAVDHVQRQHVRSVREGSPRSHSLIQPYDRFKRASEELMEQLCTTTNGVTPIRHTSLRLGAIFSDDPACIQCRALALQCFTGPYLATAIDCNSSRNAAHLIRMILQSSTAQPKELLPIYYYTRCVSRYPNPVPYGEYLKAYRRAYDLDWFPIFIPSGLVEWCVVRPLHWFTRVIKAVTSRWHASVPFLESVDYLLQVTRDEHTFDMTETIHSFPGILGVEESMEECFRRRRKILALTKRSDQKTKAL